MSKAIYQQRGESLDYKNTTAATVTAGSIVALSGILGVCAGDIVPGAVGALHVEGVFVFPKTGTAAITMGSPVYYDGTGITETETDHTLAGYAAADATAAATTIAVKLNR